MKGDSDEKDFGDKEESMHGQEARENAIETGVGVDHSEVRRKRVDEIVELVV